MVFPAHALKNGILSENDIERVLGISLSKLDILLVGLTKKSNWP